MHVLYSNSLFSWIYSTLFFYYYSNSYRWPSINRSVTFQNLLRRCTRIMRFTNNSKAKTSALKVNPALITIIVPPKCLQVIRLYSMLSDSSFWVGELLSRSHFKKSPDSIAYWMRRFISAKRAYWCLATIDMAMLRIFCLFSKQYISSLEIAGLFEACFRETATAKYRFQANVAKQSSMLSQILINSVTCVGYYEWGESVELPK